MLDNLGSRMRVLLLPKLPHYWCLSFYNNPWRKSQPYHHVAEDMPVSNSHNIHQPFLNTQLSKQCVFLSNWIWSRSSLVVIFLTELSSVLDWLSSSGIEFIWLFCVLLFFIGRRVLIISSEYAPTLRSFCPFLKVMYFFSLTVSFGCASLRPWVSLLHQVSLFFPIGNPMGYGVR